MNIYTRSSLATACVTSALAFGAISAVAAIPTQRILNEGEQFAAAQPQSLQPLFKALYVEGEHNAVLNLDYLGLAALEDGHFDIAEKAFDAAITRIEAVYADNPSAKKAKSVFAAERVKDFKGEPYERAMTLYYRGLLYLRSGDYQNARASFLAAEWQSTLSENEAYDSSFGLMDYLGSFASHCDGDAARAQELRDRAVKVQPTVFSALPADASYLELVDVGSGPTKVGVGQYKERLTFRPTEKADAVAVSTADGNASTGVLAGDVNWQATTRNGRPIDAILDGKAQWKSGTDTASQVLTGAGYAATLQGAYSNNQSLVNAGATGMVAGLLGSLISHAMTPAADTRAWTSLPAAIVLQASTLPGDETPTMTFSTSAGDSGHTAFNARHGQCAVSWGRTHSSLAAALSQLKKPVIEESKHEQANAAFRSALQSTFAPVTAAN
jgi:tetratricopeptide (TPR) repeat protein